VSVASGATFLQFFGIDEEQLQCLSKVVTVWHITESNIQKQKKSKLSNEYQRLASGYFVNLRKSECRMERLCIEQND